MVCRANDDMQNEDLKWATELGNSSTKMVWEHLKEKFNEQEVMEMGRGLTIDSEKQPRQFAGLYIFVSSSMPKPLLKNYIKETNKYGGVVVFKGLPNGSFKELTSLIIELTGTKNGELEQNPSMQIDDEAFDRFNITSVPSIVLAKEEEYIPNQSLNITYDKISGNVGVKYALEEFAKSGELHKQAAESFHESK